MRRPARGFTLIELLVVIAIIAVLIGLVFPALGTARETSRRTKCLANLRGIGTGFQLYLNDSKGIFPLVRPFHDGGGNQNDPSLLEVLADYTDVAPPRRGEDGHWIVNDPYRCPSDISSDSEDDNFEPTWRTIGLSYEYIPGGLMLVGEIFNIAPERMAHGVTRAYEGRESTPILIDAKGWHKLRAAGSKQNALYFPDMRADWRIEMPDSEMQAFMSLIIRLARGN